MESYKIFKQNQKRQKKNERQKIGIKNKRNKQKTVTNMSGINPTISIITLNINGLNAAPRQFGAFGSEVCY